MKFLRITFRCFGPFEEQTIDLSGSGGLHIVFGQNEAGKSSAHDGWLAFLFGFPGQVSYDFRFRYNQFRIHAVCKNSRDDILECIRRKGNKDTLRKACDKEVIPDRMLTDFLGGVDRDQFEQLFGLNMDRLRDGGEEISTGGGEIGGALFAAGAGMKKLRVLSQQLKDQQDALYRPAGRNQVITEALRERRDLDAKVRDLLLPAQVYVDAEAACTDVRIKLESLNRKRLTTRTRLSLLNRYSAALPTIGLLKGARDRLALVADAPLLSPDFDSRLATAREEFAQATLALGELEADRQALAERLDQTQPPAEVLLEEAEIGDIRKLVGADQKSRPEEVRARTFSIDEDHKARDIFRELTGSTDWDRMDDLKPRLDQRTRINELANKKAALVDEVHRLDKAMREANAEVARVREELGRLPTASDPGAASELVSRIVALGPLEQQLEKLVGTIQKEEQLLTGAFARFNPAPRVAWQDAPGLPVPMSQSIEEFRGEFERTQSAVDKLSNDRREVEREIADIQAALHSVDSEPVPSVEELSNLRLDRDAGLHFVRQRLMGGVENPLEAEFNDRHAPGRPLIDAVESSVHGCDTVADRLRHEADRVAQARTLQSQYRALQERLAQIKVDQNAFVAERAAVEANWQAAWPALAAPCPAPKVMQAWLAEWKKFCERVDVWKVNCIQRDESRKDISALAEELAAACPTSRGASSLAAGIAAAKRAIDSAVETRAKAASLGADVNRLETEIGKAREQLDSAKNRLAEWERQWSEAVAVLMLDNAALSIETAQSYLGRIDQMQQFLSNMRIQKARVREIQAERILLLERINRLRQRLDSDARPTTAETLDADFQAIESLLEDARILNAARAGLENQLRTVNQKLDANRNKLSDAVAALEALAFEAKVESSALAEVVQRARERVVVMALVRDYEEAVAKNAQGQPLEDFIGAALAAGADLEPQIADLENRAGQLDHEIADAHVRLKDAERLLAGYQQASDAACEVQQNAAMVESRIEEKAIEYAALHLARATLDKAKERYRARHQDTLLDRAGIYFRDLTSGGFGGIEIDYEDGEDVLKAVRADNNRPDARVPVAGLSDGTRDQLFLALRLAAIEQHLKEREPVPLIVDDVLVSFDDARAKATLGCLAELSKQTQVILFTHHRHIVDLAKAVQPESAVHVLGSGC